MTKRQNDSKTEKQKDKKQNYKKTKTQKHKNTNRQRPNREFNIVTSGHFRTLAMLSVYLQSIYTPTCTLTRKFVPSFGPK